MQSMQKASQEYVRKYAKGTADDLDRLELYEVHAAKTAAYSRMFGAQWG